MYLMASSPTQGYRFCLPSATTTVDAAWLARMVGFQYALVSPFPMRRILTSGRLLGLKQGRVRFQWRDSKDHNQIKETSLDVAVCPACRVADLHCDRIARRQAA